MVFENIEKLKQDYTDKYVVVDATRPELRRFQYLTGVVKTVNMNGRALVEFDGHQNIGWYDIDLDFLKVVDKPQAVEAPKKQEAPAKPAAAKPATKPQAAAPAAKASGGMSVSDILAAARGGGATAAKPAETAKPAAKPAETAKPAAAKSMSVADILAAARGQAAPSVETEPPAAEEPAAEEPSSAEPPVASSPPAPEGDLPTTVPEILAFCRRRDG